MKVVFMLAAIVLLACSSASSSSPPSSSAPTGTGGHLCSQYTLCSKSGNSFTCDCGGGTMPACPSPTIAQPGQACPSASTPACMMCDEPGSMSATIICSCQSDADGGLTWSCVGGEQACSE